jgi:hypothetical protein
LSAGPPARDIAPGVHRLGSSLVNWYLVEEGGRLTAVDAGLPGYRKTLLSDLSLLGHVPGDVDALVPYARGRRSHRPRRGAARRGRERAHPFRGRTHLAHAHVDRR